MGQDPNHGPGSSRIHALDPGGKGDVTSSRKIWENDSVGRSICTPVVHDGLLYMGDYNGLVHAIDVKTGKTIWSHDLFAGVWSGLLVANGRVYVGDEDGTVTVFRASRKKEVLATNDVREPIWSCLLYTSPSPRDPE